jgi:hypothetical protein
MHKVFSILVGAAALFALTLGAAVVPAQPATASVTLAAAVAAASCNDGLNRKVTIINETGVAMREFYASPPDAEVWEDDILGQGVVKPYGSVVIDFDDGRCRCVYDFKAVFTDGDELIRQKINVCDIGTYRYY